MNNFIERANIEIWENDWKKFKKIIIIKQKQIKQKK